MTNLAAARERLAQVPDPEIPAVTLVDLGIVRDLRETASGVEVVLTPTYSGCPATELIADDVRAALAEFGDVTVTLQRAPAWSTDWITPDRVMNVPSTESRKVATTSVTFHFRSIPRFSWIMIECRNAVPVSQGRRDAFSTGSHIQ